MLLLDKERPHALGAVDLVRAEGEQIDSVTDYIQVDLARCLGSVSVQKRPAIMRHRGNLGERRQAADLVVCGGNRDEQGPLVDRRLELR